MENSKMIKVYRIKDICQMLKITPKALRTIRKLPDFPAPVGIFKRNLRFIASDIDVFLLRKEFQTSATSEGSVIDSSDIETLEGKSPPFYNSVLVKDDERGVLHD